MVFTANPPRVVNDMVNLHMGTIVLIVAFVAEAVIAAARWATPAQPMLVKRVVRISMGTAFWLLTLAGVIPWSFRWYGLAALLSVWALREGWLLYRKREAPQAVPTPTRIVFHAGAAALLAFIAVTPALIFPPYALPEPTGQHVVATAKYTFTDENRREPPQFYRQVLSY